MSNRRDIEPSLDYFELRRMHEEYKNSQRQKGAAGTEPEAAGEAAPQAEYVNAPASTPVVEAAPLTEAEEVRPQPVRVEAPAAEPEDVAPEAADAPGEMNLSGAPDADAASGDGNGVDSNGGFTDDIDDIDDVDGPVDGENPNPFDSFIHAFRGLRGKLANRFGRRGEDVDYDEEPLDGDEPLDDDAPLEERLKDELPDEPAPAAPATEAAGEARPEAADAANAPVEDVLEDAPARPAAPPAGDRDAPEDGDLDEDDGYYEDDGYDEDDRGERVSRFKKFLRLFVVRVDEDEAGSAPQDGDYDEDDYEADDGDRATEETAWEAPAREEDSAHGGEAEWAAPRVEDSEGGPDMSDLSNVKTEVTDALAAGIEGTGMSRRERRELALRLAAEKAAAEAAAQAAREDEVQAAAVVTEVAEQEAEGAAQTAAAPGTEGAAGKAEEPALEADAIEDVSKGIVNIETAKDEYDAVADEPTREYKAVSKASLDDLMNDKDLDNDGDQDDEEDEKPARRGLFGRRRKARDEDDYDDEDDDEDEDEEEDERPRRGLFGRRRRARDEDEDDEDDDEYDDDEDDDEDDRRGRKSRRGRRYDEDDEDDDDDDYDEYDDDEYDDYDDDDEDRTSFGHVLLGILKGFLTAVMLLLFVVVVLNVLNIFGVVNLSGLANRLPTRMAQVFLPSEGMKQRMNVEANANPAPVAEGVPLVPQASQPPVAEAQPEPVEAAPVAEAPVEEAPVEEAPAANEAPAEAEGEAETAGEAVG